MYCAEISETPKSLPDRFFWTAAKAAAATTSTTASSDAMTGAFGGWKRRRQGREELGPKPLPLPGPVAVSE